MVPQFDDSLKLGKHGMKLSFLLDSPSVPLEIWSYIVDGVSLLLKLTY